MRKTKLLLVAFLAMVGLSVNAQSWTAASVEEGEFLLYNVGKGQYFTKGNGWGTQASMTSGSEADGLGSALKVELVESDGYYLIRTLVFTDPDWGLELLQDQTIYTDQSRDGKLCSWEFLEVDEDNGPVYNIITQADHAGGSGVYLTANEENTILGPGDDGTTDYAKWKLLPAAKASLLNSIALYNDKKALVLAISNDIDVSAADAKANSATTAEEYDEAISMLIAALNDYLVTLEDAEIDLTDLFVVNPSFETGNTNGWTVQSSNDTGAKDNNNDVYHIDNADGAYVFNIWSSGNPISQTIEGLPNGNYMMTALIATDAGHQVQLNANDVRVVVDAAEEGKGHGVEGEVEFTVLDGTATIGAEGVNKYWYKVDNFHLYFLGALTDLTPYADRLAKAVTDAEAVEEGTVPASAYSTLQDALTDYNKTWNSADEYDEAIKAIEDATAAAKALVAPYAAFLDMKAIAEDLASANSDNASGKADLVDAISTQSDAVENAESAEDITAATAELKSVMTDYANNSNPVGEGERFNLTFMLTNPDLTNLPGWEKAEGWYNDQTQPTQNSQVMNSNAAVANSADPTKFAMYEYWSAGTEPTEGYVVYQKVTLPEGTYKMTALAFAGFGGGHRYGYQTDGDHGLGPLGDGSPNITFSAGEIDGTPITTPTLEDASIDFVQEAEGEVKIGLKAHAGNRSNWMGIGYVELFKVQSNDLVIDEDVAFEAESVAGNVTLKRVMNPGEWNTFAVPFSITNEELMATFGEGTEVAEFSEAYATETTVDEGTGEDVVTPIENESIIAFNLMETPAVTANRPVLLKPVSVPATAEYEFKNRTVAEGIAYVTGLNFEFVGNYDGEITLTENDYFLNSNKIYKSNGTNKLKGTRAYIAPKADGARIVGFFIDGVSEDVTGIEGLLINNDFAGKLYNLNGQQVKSAKKGLYIRDGKKVVVK
jgi:hypothetical protein